LSKSCLNLQILQKKVIRIMNFANYRDHAIPLFYDFKILPMSFLYFYNTACFMHDIVNGKSPLHITTLFMNVCDVHSYNTIAAARKNSSHSSSAPSRSSLTLSRSSLAPSRSSLTPSRSSSAPSHDMYENSLKITKTPKRHRTARSQARLRAIQARLRAMINMRTL
jgi:hypothetical protein